MFTVKRRTRAEYDAIPIKDPDIFYIVLETDETFSLYLGEEPLKTSIGGGGGGYAPDEDTIVLNENDELEATNVIIWGYE